MTKMSQVICDKTVRQCQVHEDPRSRAGEYRNEKWLLARANVAIGARRSLGVRPAGAEGMAVTTERTLAVAHSAAQSVRKAQQRRRGRGRVCARCVVVV